MSADEWRAKIAECAEAHREAVQRARSVEARQLGTARLWAHIARLYVAQGRRYQRLWSFYLG